jgi:hypothetical protein
MRLSKKLIKITIEEIKKTSLNVFNENIKKIFIEVLIPENVSSSDDSSDNDIELKNFDKQRQQIWSKLNFLPLDFSFKHPGVLKWKEYQLAEFNDNLTNTDDKISKLLLLSFLEDFFYFMIGKYDNTYINEICDIKKKLTKNNKDFIEASTLMWK